MLSPNRGVDRLIFVYELDLIKPLPALRRARQASARSENNVSAATAVRCALPGVDPSH
jgi:hypothetical protein